MDNKWLEVYKANYYNKSDEAKSLEGSIKQKGSASYIPWAIMERLLYFQDPAAEFKVLTNDKGGVIFTDKEWTTQRIETKDALDYTEVVVFNHMVRVQVTFLGKTITEDYPLQRQEKGKGFVAPKVYDANMANKTIKRALAKAASRASGLGLGLYETGDLQFEDSSDAEQVEDTSTVAKKEPKTTTKVKEEVKPTTQPKVAENSNLEEIAKKIKGQESLNAGLKKLNVPLMKKYGFAISTEDSIEDLVEKLSHIPDPQVFLDTVVKQTKK